MDYSSYYEIMFLVALIIIALCLGAVLIKSIIGPRLTDRIMTINMVGTIVTSCIAILSSYFISQAYLIDVCIIYVLISFVSVVVLSSVFINRYKERKLREKKLKEMLSETKETKEEN